MGKKNLKKESDIEYPFEHGEINHYKCGWGIMPSHYKDTGILPNLVAGEEGNRSGISP